MPKRPGQDFWAQASLAPQREILWGIARRKSQMLKDWAREIDGRAAAERAAENGATAHQLMSILGWMTLAVAERYTKAVRQKVMAGEAMDLLTRTKER